VLRCVGRASLLLRRTLGVGGRQSVASEPLRATRDLVASDLRAIVAGEWRRIVLERHAVHS
jgi:hypothetical protein